MPAFLASKNDALFAATRHIAASPAIQWGVPLLAAIKTGYPACIAAVMVDILEHDPMRAVVHKMNDFPA